MTQIFMHYLIGSCHFGRLLLKENAHKHTSLELFIQGSAFYKATACQLRACLFISSPSGHPLLKVIFLVYRLILLPLSQASLMEERSHPTIVSSIKITIGQQQYTGWKHPCKNHPQDSRLISGPYLGDGEEFALIERLLELCTWPCFKHSLCAMIIYLFLQATPNMAGHALVLKRKR